MEKHIVCAALSEETTPSFLWEDFMNENENIKDHLSGLGCVMEEVLIVSTGNSFLILGISSGLSAVLMFFKSFHVENYLRTSQTTTESINYLMEGVTSKGRFTSAHLRKAFIVAKREGSLGPGFNYLYRLLFEKQSPLTVHRDMVKQVHEIINRSFLCV